MTWVKLILDIQLCSAHFQIIQIPENYFTRVTQHLRANSTIRSYGQLHAAQQIRWSSTIKAKVPYSVHSPNLVPYSVHNQSTTDKLVVSLAVRKLVQDS
jgi:hypothetical protein